MKILMILAVLVSSVFITGCNGILGDSVSGVWRAKVVHERSVDYIEMELKERGGKITGTMSILEGRGDTFWKAETIPIVQSQRSNKKVKLLVAKGDDIDDGLSFDLSLVDGKLTGVAYELGSRREPVEVKLYRKK